MRALLVAAALGVAGVAGVPAPAQAEQAVQADRATALAERVLDRSIMIPAELAMGKAAFEMGLDSDSDTRAMLAETPGLREALWAALEPEMRRSIEADHPAFVAVVAAIYRARLTEPEIEALHIFFGTPTGGKLIARMYGSVDPAPVFADVMAGEQVSAGSLEKAAEAAKREAVASIGREDHAALEALGRSMPLAKMTAVGAEVQKATLEWINRPDPALDARVDAIIGEVLERYGLTGEG